MASKIKLNKNSLRDQNRSLRLYREFLPTLELRKQQLQAEVRKVRARIAERQRALQSVMESAGGFAPMLATTLKEACHLVKVAEVEVSKGNVAGVKVPVFQKVRFEDVPYSLVGTSPFMDAALAFWRKAVAARAEMDVLRQQEEALSVQLVKTTQRINLYEKVLIPECKENIRKIKVYLGDQQTAAVCRAKAAKGKLTRAAEAEAAAAQGG